MKHPQDFPIAKMNLSPYHWDIDDWKAYRTRGLFRALDGTYFAAPLQLRKRPKLQF